MTATQIQPAPAQTIPVPVTVRTDTPAALEVAERAGGLRAGLAGWPVIDPVEQALAGPAGPAV